MKKITLLLVFLYTDWLLELLIRQVATQQQYAGEEALHFDDENIQALIRRCVTVGRRIYHVESHSSMKNKGLFVVIGTPAWPDTPENVVYLRLNESQPKLMEAKLHTVAVNPATAYPDVCIEVLEHYAANPEALTDYKARADQLYFPIPTILTQTATSSQLFKLREQVSSGAISVDQFIQRLCEIATMIQQEQ